MELGGWRNSRSNEVREVTEGWGEKTKTLVALGAYRWVCDVVALETIQHLAVLLPAGLLVCVGGGLPIRGSGPDTGFGQRGA